MTKSLDLGCGQTPNNPFNASDVFGIDVRDGLGTNIYCVDLTLSPIPFENNYFEYVTAFQFIEHIPRVIYTPTRKNPFIDLMSEINRVLKVGGIFVSVTPAYPRSEAFQDPTHVNIITEETFPSYFCVPRVWGSMYGFIGKFHMISQSWQDANLITQLQKV